MGVCGIYRWGLAQKHPTQAKHQHIQNDLQRIVIDTVELRTHISESGRHYAHKENELSKASFENNEFMIYEQIIHHSI